MPNQFGLHYDGDLRRIYEVPENSSFTTDGDGYRIYVPDDIAAASRAVFNTNAFLWSTFVRFHDLNKWTTLAMSKSGGAFRFTDASGNDNYAPFDIRLINGWELVPADYPHQWTIQGNVYPNADTGQDFDTSRLTAQGVSPRVAFSVEGTVVQTGASGLTQQESEVLRDLLRLARADEHYEGDVARKLDEDTGEVLLDKVVTGGTAPVSPIDIVKVS